MKYLPSLVGLALLALCCGCASVSPQHAAIVRTLPTDDARAIEVISSTAADAGFRQVGPHDFQRTLRTRQDPIIGLVEISKEMDEGLGFTVRLESSGAATLVTFEPYHVVRLPFTKHFERTPLRPGTKHHASIGSVADAAKARAEFISK